MAHAGRDLRDSAGLAEANMEHTDVIVVGGGPAGSTCARALVQQGARVTLLDRAVFPRDKLCTGWITQPVVDQLALDLDEYVVGRVLQPLHGFRTSLLGQRDTLVEFSRTVGYGIRRAEFDTYLLRRSGARVVEGAQVRTVRRAGLLWVVDEQWAAPLLIGAGGHFCPVARVVNPHRDASVIVARDVEVPIDGAVVDGPARAGVPELHFCRDLKGYGWLVVKGHVVSIGLGREDTHQLDRHADDFVRHLKALGRVPEPFAPKWRGHAYLLAQSSTRRAAAESTLLVGDAAGLAAHVSGEGIRAAVESGLLAAACVGQCGGDYSMARLERYERQLSGALDYRGARAASGSLSAGASAIAAAAMRIAAPALFSSSWFVRHALERVFLPEPEATRASSRSAGKFPDAHS